MVPVTALTDRPSGARLPRLLPKKARNIIDEPSTRSHSGRDRAISQLVVLGGAVAELGQHLGRMLAKAGPGGVAAGRRGGQPHRRADLADLAEGRVGTVPKEFAGLQLGVLEDLV